MNSAMLWRFCDRASARLPRMAVMEGSPRLISLLLVDGRVPRRRPKGSAPSPSGLGPGEVPGRERVAGRREGRRVVEDAPGLGARRIGREARGDAGEVLRPVG